MLNWNAIFNVIIFLDFFFVYDNLQNLYGFKYSNQILIVYTQLSRLK